MNPQLMHQVQELYAAIAALGILTVIYPATLTLLLIGVIMTVRDDIAAQFARTNNALSNITDDIRRLKESIDPEGLSGAEARALRQQLTDLADRTEGIASIEPEPEAPPAEEPPPVEPPTEQPPAEAPPAESEPPQQ